MKTDALTAVDIVEQYYINNMYIYLARDDCYRYYLMLPSKSGSDIKHHKDTIKQISKGAWEAGLLNFSKYVCVCRAQHHSINFQSGSPLKRITYEAIYDKYDHHAVAIGLQGLTLDIANNFFQDASRKRNADAKKERESYATFKAQKRAEEIADERNEKNSRDPKIKEAAKSRDGYMCRVPGCSNRFRTRSGEQFVEVHHIKPLNGEGKDELNNVICLCSHHHSQVHYADDAGREEVEKAIRDAMKEKAE